MNKWLQTIRGMSLRKRIVYLFSIAAFIPFISSVLLSYNAIYSILENKLESSAINTLKQTELSLSHTMDNLAQISQQFVYPSNTALNLNSYLETDDLSKGTALNEEIQTELDYITYTNAAAGLAVYIGENGEQLYRNMLIREDFTVEELPFIGEYNDISYYGPHISNNPLNTQYVISIIRDVELPNEKNVTLYLESSFSITKNIINMSQSMNNSFYLLLDEEGRIAFSELASIYPVDHNFYKVTSTASKGSTNGFYWFKSTNTKGWSMVSLIPQAKFDQEKNTWIKQMVFLAIVFGVCSLLIALLVWKMVYKPVRMFDSEIEAISNNNLTFKSEKTNIPEFDHSLNQLQVMKQQITELISEVEIKEKKRADLEIEKLLHQINPHFLMNTLDTVHWLAVIHKQEEIDKMVSALNKLLYYNLKRSGNISTIEEELDSLKQYCTLQEIRYDFQYHVDVRIESSWLEAKIPKFVLQPIVENSIHHGLEDGGCINVVIDRIEDKYLMISIKDNGQGLTQQEINQILNQESHHANQIGIGLNYVKTMLNSYFEGDAQFRMESEMDIGTTVTLIVPIILD